MYLQLAAERTVEVWKSLHDEAMSAWDVQEAVTDLLAVADRIERAREAGRWSFIDTAPIYYELLVMVRDAAKEMLEKATSVVRRGYDIDRLDDLQSLVLRLESWTPEIEMVMMNLRSPARTLEDIRNGNSGVRS